MNIIEKCDFTKRHIILQLPFLSIRLYNNRLKFLQYQYIAQMQLIFAISIIRWITYVSKVRSVWNYFAAKFEDIFRTKSINYVNHNVAEEDPYDKGVVKNRKCVLLSVYIHSVSTCFQSKVKTNWAETVAKFLNL